MSDIIRMLRVSESDPVQQEAADEIERLRAELAAERERTKAIEEELDLREQEDCSEENYLQSQVDKLTAERDELRAALEAVVKGVNSTRASIGVACVDLEAIRRARAALKGDNRE